MKNESNASITKFIRLGWLNDINPDLYKFKAVQESLSAENDCIIIGQKLFMLDKLVQVMFEKLPASHLEITATQTVTRELFLVQNLQQL